jgi:hypothetical protein
MIDTTGRWHWQLLMECGMNGQPVFGKFVAREKNVVRPNQQFWHGHNFSKDWFGQRKKPSFSISKSKSKRRLLDPSQKGADSIANLQMMRRQTLVNSHT